MWSKKAFILGSMWTRSNGLKTVFDDVELKELRALQSQPEQQYFLIVFVCLFVLVFGFVLLGVRSKLAPKKDASIFIPFVPHTSSTQTTRE